MRWIRPIREGREHEDETRRQVRTMGQDLAITGFLVSVLLALLGLLHVGEEPAAHKLESFLVGLPLLAPFVCLVLFCIGQCHFWGWNLSKLVSTALRSCDGSGRLCPKRVRRLFWLMTASVGLSHGL